MDIRKFLLKTDIIDLEKALPDAVVFCTKDGKIQWVNEKAVEVFSTSKMHLLTSNVEDFIENAIKISNVAVISESSLIVKLLSAEIYYEMTAKEIEEGFVLSLRYAKNQDEAKLIKEENDSYKEVNRDKNIFLLKLVNDFKSPLQSIVGFAQAMSDGLGGKMSEQQEKYIKIIKKHSSELMYFTSKLLELSETEASVKIPELKTFDIENALNSLVRFNEQLYKEKDLKLNILSEDGFKKIICSDEIFIKNIVQDILDVILKTIDMGEVLISLSMPTEESLQNRNLSVNDCVQISISSSSLLLSEGELDCIFDPYKVIDSSSRKNLLRAIILASVKNMVQALNGFIWVESTILKNTSFNIIIPSKSV